VADFILGTVISDHDSAVCLLSDGRPAFILAEERLCGVKRGDPRNSIRRALSAALSLSKISMSSIRAVFCDADMYYPPDSPPQDVFPDMPDKSGVVQIPHHLGHVASAFFPSPFDEAAVLSIDASGGIAPIREDKNAWGISKRELDFIFSGFTPAHRHQNFRELADSQVSKDARNYPAESASFCLCRRGSPILELEDRFASESLGYFYALSAMFLDMEEGSLMGLAGHGKPSRYIDILNKILQLLPDGRIAIDPDYMHFWSQDRVLENPVAPDKLKEKFYQSFGRPRKAPESIDQHHADFAYAVQTRLEDAICHMASYLYQITEMPNLCLAGGVGLNSVANGKILERTPFKRLFVQPAATDDGIALGNALFGYYVLSGLPNRRWFDMGNARFGPAYNNAQIDELISSLSNGKVPIRYYASLPSVRNVTLRWRKEGGSDFIDLAMQRDPDGLSFNVAAELPPGETAQYEFIVEADQPESKVQICDVASWAKIPLASLSPEFAKFVADHAALAGILDGENAFCGPEQVVIDPTNRCNNNCIPCWTNSPLLGEAGPPSSWHSTEMPDKMLSLLIDELADMGTRRIRLTGGGEPLMHPHAINVMEKAKSLGMAVGLTTNFTLFDEATIRRLVDIGIDEIAVSLWAADPQTYARSHPNKSEAAFYHIEKNLRLLCNLKAPSTKVVLANVMFSMTFDQAPRMVRFAEEVGADAVYFALVDSVHIRTDGLLLTPPMLARLQNDLLEISSQKNDIEIQNLDGLLVRLTAKGASKGDYDEEEVEKFPCVAGWIFARIMADGTVAPCCRGVSKPMGNLANGGFAKVWHSSSYAEFRKHSGVSKRHKYFSPIGCRRTCDNLIHNKEALARLRGLSKKEQNDLLEAARQRLRRSRT